MHRIALAALLCSALACFARADSINKAEPSATTSLQEPWEQHRFELNSVTELRPPSASNFIFDLSALSHIAWSNDGKMIAAYNDALSSISVWNTNSGSLVSHVTRTNILNPDIPLAFSKDGKVLIAAAPVEDRSLPAVSLLDVASGQLIQNVPGPFPAEGWRDNIAHLTAFSPATQTLIAAFGSLGGKTLVAYRFDKDDRLSPLTTIDAADVPIARLAFSPNGKLLAVGSVDGTVTIYETVTWKAVDKADFFPESLTISGEGKNSIFSLAFSPTGKALAAGAFGINLTRHRPSSLPYGQRDPALAAEPFVSNALRSPIRIYDLANRRFYGANIEVKQPVSQLSWGRENLLLLTADDGGLTQCIVAGERTATARLIRDRVLSFALSPNNQKVAVSANDKITVYTIDVR